MKRKYKRRELTSEESDFVAIVKCCSRDLDDILQGARHKSQQNVETFLSYHIAMLYRAIDIYKDLFKRLKAPSLPLLQQVFEKFSGHETCVETVEWLHETDNYWKNFLRVLEDDVRQQQQEQEEDEDNGGEEERTEQKQAEQLARLAAAAEEEKDGDENENEEKRISKINLREMAPNWSLKNVKTKQNFNLIHHLEAAPSTLIISWSSLLPSVSIKKFLFHLMLHKEEFDATKTQIVIITNGTRESIQQWCTVLNMPDDCITVLNDSRNLSGIDLQLKTSISNIWSIDNVKYWALEKYLDANNFGLVPRDVNWQILQHLGGCLLVDSSLQISFHRKIVTLSDAEKIFPLAEQLIKITCGQFVRKSPDLAKKIVDQIALSEGGAGSAGSGDDVSPEQLFEALQTQRRHRIPPDTFRLQFEPTSGMYFDPLTHFYYHPASNYFYNPVTFSYVYWNEKYNRYLPVAPVASHAAASSSSSSSSTFSTSFSTASSLPIANSANKSNSKIVSSTNINGGIAGRQKELTREEEKEKKEREENENQQLEKKQREHLEGSSSQAVPAEQSDPPVRTLLEQKSPPPNVALPAAVSLAVSAPPPPAAALAEQN